MPIVSRSYLRQRVGQLRLRDTYVGTTSGSLDAVGSAYVIDAAVANLAFSGESLFQRAWLKVNGMEFQVASFNTGSGAYVTLQTAATIVPSGAQYERHLKLSPAQKDREIDGVVGRLWTRQELPISTIDGRLQYSIGQGFKVFGVYYFANPTGSIDRQPREMPIGWNIATTGSGREIRLPFGGALGGSQQIVLDAQVRATLGAADTATINIPDEDWVLNGITARCYQAMAADAPGQEANRYEKLAVQYGAEFVKGIGRWRDTISSTWRGAFDEVVA